ncbi:MAG: hypothetical protein CK425_13085 [Parachlamydia sp.]|nr:MAG: hypothetical protein CK425_13085 [Parachlamydia sp.]
MKWLIGIRPLNALKIQSLYFSQTSLSINRQGHLQLNENDDQKQKNVLAVRERLLPYTIGDYVGNPDPDLTNYLTEYYGANIARFEWVKLKHDPENIFSLNRVFL